MRSLSKNILSTAFIMTYMSCSEAMMANAESMEYVLDGEHTHIVWQVDRFGFTKTVGSFANITGKLILDESAPENSKVEATIALSGLRSDLQEREDIVRQGVWLDASNHPVITFKSTSVTLIKNTEDNKRARVIGDMTLKGMTAPLTMDVILNKIGTDPVTRKKAMGFTATGTFMRSEYGVKIAMGPIGDEVTFQIEALAIAKE